MKENTNPLLWYVCKFCRRAFQQPRDLVRHKKAEHLDRILEEDKVKRLQKNNTPSRTLPVDKSESADKLTEEKTDSTEEINEKNIDGTDSSNSSVTSENEPSLSDPSTSSTSENNSESEKEDRELESETPENSESPKSTCAGVDENSGQIDSDHTNSSLDEFQTFKCQTCSKICTSERTLGLHVQFVHTKENSYPCKYCSMSFSHPRSRSCHIAKDHVDELCKSALSGGSSRKRGVEKVRDCCAEDRKRPKTLGKPESDSSPGEAGNDCSSSTKSSTAVPRKDASSTSTAYNCPTCNKRFLSKRKYQLHQSYHRRNPKDKEESVSDLHETLPIEFSRRNKKSVLGSREKTTGNRKR